jgi:hypothetical protein
MKKYFIFLLLLSLGACSLEKQTVVTNDLTMVTDINNSILDGFYNNDTTKISEHTYLLK